MEHLLKSRLHEADARQHDSSDEEDVAADAAEGPADGKTVKAEECMTCDMDFSENYDITHKVEIQSEHWAHEQVTLYIHLPFQKQDQLQMDIRGACFRLG